MDKEKGLNDVPNGVVQEKAQHEIKRPIGFGVRHFQVFLLCCGFTIAFTLRVNLSVGIVAMSDNSSNPNFEQFDWPQSIRGIILSSLFWGYAISPVPAGLLAHKFGVKVLLLLAMIFCSLLTIFTPFIAKLGWEYMCASRLLQGICQGFFFPCIHTFLSKWVHPSERGFLSSIIYVGGPIGSVLILAGSGFIAASSMGWPGIFYISGGCAAAWTIFWLLLASNSPADHTTISIIEREYIESMAGRSSKKSAFPWKAVLTSGPFLALLITHCAQNWGFWTLLTEIPSYMNGVLSFDIQSNALFSALPYLAMVIFTLFISQLSDILMNRNIISISNGRKLFNTIGHWVPMVCLIALGYVTKENTSIAITLLTLAVAANGSIHVGFLVNHMDLSPNFAGGLMGLSHGISNIMSLLGPLFVGFVVTDTSDPALWRIFFFVTAGLYFFCNLMFIIFGKASIQKWNNIS